MWTASIAGHSRTKPKVQIEIENLNRVIRKCDSDLMKHERNMFPFQFQLSCIKIYGSDKKIRIRHLGGRDLNLGKNPLQSCRILYDVSQKPNVCLRRSSLCTELGSPGHTSLRGSSCLFSCACMCVALHWSGGHMLNRWVVVSNLL